MSETSDDVEKTPQEYIKSIETKVNDYIKYCLPLIPDHTFNDGMTLKEKTNRIVGMLQYAILQNIHDDALLRAYEVQEARVKNDLKELDVLKEKITTQWEMWIFPHVR